MDKDVDDVMCYAARMPGKPGYVMITVDLPEHAKDNAKEVARVIRQGGSVERVTRAAAIVGMQEYYRSQIKPQQSMLAKRTKP